MTSTDFTTVQNSASRSSTRGFGAQHHQDRPASARRAGTQSMPSAWQTRGVSTQGGQNRYDAPPRSIGDIIADPFRRVFTTPVRKLAAGAGAIVGLLILIF